jgi:23S rRNA U2552 (ribose-2'-O)-methylase RlmE/FtsJ
MEKPINFFAGVRNAVDLCAAPGSWSQVLSRRLNLSCTRSSKPVPEPKIVAVDLQPMAPVEGVITIQVCINCPLNNQAYEVEAHICAAFYRADTLRSTFQEFGRGAPRSPLQRDV